MLGPPDGEIMRPFVDLLALVNAIAESSPGFLRRDKTTAVEGLYESARSRFRSLSKPA